MVRQLALKNYIPGGARNHYAQAFAREFRKFLGQPVEEELCQYSGFSFWGRDAPSAVVSKWMSGTLWLK